MIFVTVGTHEQQFNRLIKKVDELKRDSDIQEEVYMQIGYSTYIPKCCKWKRFLAYDKMNDLYTRANIIITHGGPASFMKALEIKKMPVVVPRQEKYGEHVNNHQMEFVKLVEKRFGNIIGVYDIDELKEAIDKSHSFVQDGQFMVSNNYAFNENFSKIISTLSKELKK